jgi:hypothetical protein
MVEFVAYVLFLLVVIGALHYMMAGVELEAPTNGTSTVAPVAPTRIDGPSSAQ